MDWNRDNAADEADIEERYQWLAPVFHLWRFGWTFFATALAVLVITGSVKAQGNPATQTLEAAREAGIGILAMIAFIVPPIAAAYIGRLWFSHQNKKADLALKELEARPKPISADYVASQLPSVDAVVGVLKATEANRAIELAQHERLLNLYSEDHERTIKLRERVDNSEANAFRMVEEQITSNRELKTSVDGYKKAVEDTIGQVLTETHLIKEAIGSKGESDKPLREIVQEGLSALEQKLSSLPDRFVQIFAEYVSRKEDADEKAIEIPAVVSHPASPDGDKPLDSGASQ